MAYIIPASRERYRALQHHLTLREYRSRQTRDCRRHITAAMLAAVLVPAQSRQCRRPSRVKRKQDSVLVQFAHPVLAVTRSTRSSALCRLRNDLWKKRVGMSPPPSPKIKSGDSQAHNFVGMLVASVGWCFYPPELRRLGHCPRITLAQFGTETGAFPHSSDR